uniref:Copper(I)-binding protein n=1 Tax=Candidatus Kentrum sp. LFY TaxID=2126342 RepID=A0A450WBT4_9GAMM|nr:MAG: hypothetical protein BECKLFY1418C_GA0070996_100914 [Candidatus Kentron sp. LFY]
MRTIVISLLLVVWTATGCTMDRSEADITITDPWIREAPPGANALAGYMLLRNRSDTDINLVNAEGPDFDTIMFHETITRSGMATMVHLEQIRIPGQKQIAFQPGGMHLMLMQPKRNLTVGDESTIILTFAGGKEVIAEFKVRKSSSNHTTISGDSNTNSKHH